MQRRSDKSNNKNQHLKRERDSSVDPQTSPQDEAAAAVKIQKQVRGFLARRKYRMPQLRKFDMESYKAFVVGNDPIIDGHEKYKVNQGKIAIVATSGMRAILLACDLGNANATPKILLIDNSREVCDFWLAMRDFMQSEHLTGSYANFQKNLKAFLCKNTGLYRNIPDLALSDMNTIDLQYPNQNIAKFFDDMFKKHGYEYVRSVIQHTSIIRQSWQSEQAFTAARHILDFHQIEKVFAYPSNILGCTQNKDQELVILKNIAKLRPVMTIHTEGVLTFSSIHSGKAHCLESCDPAHVIKELKVEENRMELGNSDDGDLTLLMLMSLFGGKNGGIRIVRAMDPHQHQRKDSDDEDDDNHSYAKPQMFFLGGFK